MTEGLFYIKEDKEKCPFWLDEKGRVFYMDDAYGMITPVGFINTTDYTDENVIDLAKKMLKQLAELKRKPGEK